MEITIKLAAMWLRLQEGGLGLGQEEKQEL
jgi:hypothetical protein